MTKREEKLPWVQWEPQKFLGGVAGLDITQIGVYSMLLNLIYENEAPIRDDRKRLARLCGAMRLDRFERIVEELVAMGKIILADGVLSNPKAEKELLRRKTVIHNLRLSSKKGGEAYAKKLKENKETGEPEGRVLAGENKSKSQSLSSSLRSEVDASAPAQPRGSAGRLKHNSEKGTRMPADYKVSNQQLLWSRSVGLTEKEAQHLAGRFVSHYRSMASTNRRAFSPDWDAKWQDWVLRQVMELGRDATSSPQLADASPKAIAETLTDENWAQIMQSYERTGRWNPRYGPPPNNPGFLGPKKVVHSG